MESTLDPVLSGAETPQIGSSMASRIKKSDSEFQQFRIFHENNNAVFGADDTSDENNKQSSAVSKKSVAAPEDIELLDTLPKSLSDIYNISNRNRWRNKDKKRNRDTTDVAPSLNVLDVAESSNNTDWYHVEKDTEACVVDNLEGTLDFAANIGWMGGDVSSREEMRKKHISNESNNNSIHANESNRNSNSQLEHFSTTSTSDNVSFSFDSKKSGAKGAKQTSNKEKSGYDYSRATNVIAMGAMSTVNTGITDRDGGKYNPFMQSSVGQGGNGGYSNSSNRSNNNNASKPRKQAIGGNKSKNNAAVIERRDTNRSLITSASNSK